MGDKIATMRLLLCMFSLMIAVFTSDVVAQGSFILSKNADFSTNDRIFGRNETLHMIVIAPQVDFTDIDKNEWKLEAGSNEHEGTFVNHLDGTYTSSLDLSLTNQQEMNWKWRARIEDDSENRIEFEVSIKISENGNNEITIQGTIQSLTAGSMVVNGISLVVDSQTQVFDVQNNMILFSDLEVGDRVSVVAVDQGQGELRAVTIKRENEPGEDIQVRGPIEELSGSTVVVVGKRFLVDAGTEIFDKDGAPLSIDDLGVGLFVEVRGVFQQDGSLVATRIELEDEGSNEVEFTGVIDTLGEDSIAVDGILFIVTGQTQVVDDDGNIISFLELRVGMVVHIRGQQDTEGVLFATRIQIEDQLGEDEIEIRGVVTARDENTLVVTGIIFQVTGSTEVLNEEGNAIEFSEVEVGFVVQVRADVQQSSQLIATRIAIEDRFTNVLEITGVIEQTGPESITVFGVEVFVTHSTDILDSDGEGIEFNDLHVGLLVEIRAELQADGTFAATRIKIRDHFGGEVEVIGLIEEIDSEGLVVAGVSFSVDSQTDILDHDGNPILFSQLEVGLIVEIKGRRQSGGDIPASSIRVLDRIEDEVKAVGIIEQITETSITILGRTFGLTNHTIFFDQFGNLVSLSNLFVGQTVEIRGVLLPDGTLVAIQITVRAQAANQIEVVGPIDSFGPSTIEVIGIHFFSDANTKFFDVNNDSIGMDDLRMGETVEVQAAGQVNGTRLAVSIRVVDILVMSSVVDQVVFNGITVLGKQILFDSHTLILGRENEFLTVDDLQTGNYVEVRAIRGNNNVIFGTKVKVLGSVTSIAPGPDQRAEVPEAFSLLQNYPNPFNPETTIKYEVPNSGSADLQVSIIVYNMLGQVVRTLVHDRHGAGVYETKWDGRDERGFSVPTGVYLYRLQAGEVVQTRRMLLMK